MSDSTTHRDFLRVGALATAVTVINGARELPAVSSPRTPVPTQGTFELDEATITALQEGMRSERYTSRSITELYLGRIDAIDRAGPAINAVIERNPDAMRMDETSGSGLR